MSDWIYTTDRVGITTPISFRKTNTQSSSVMDLHAGTYKSYPWNGANGWTEFFRYGNSVNPFIENWGWGKITLNNYNMSSKSSSQKKGVVAHEMGHVFGLDDNNTNTQTVMCQEIGGPAVTSAQKGDLKGINYLY